MARRSGGGGRAAPRPAARRPVQNAPQPASRAPPPATAQAQPQGGMMGSLGSTIAQGMAFGVGSDMAHRAVGAIMGPRTIQIENGAPEATSAPSMGAAAGGSNACGIHSKAFEDCLNSFGSDISKCQFYLDMLTECRKNGGMSV